MWRILHNLDSYIANSKNKIIKPIQDKFYSFVAFIILVISLIFSCELILWMMDSLFLQCPSLPPFFFPSLRLPPTGRHKHRVLCARSSLLPIINYLLVPNNFASQFPSHLTHTQAPWCCLYLLSSGDLLRNSFENTQILRMQFGSEGNASLLRLTQCVFISLSLAVRLTWLWLSICVSLRNLLSQKLITLLLINSGFQKTWN